MRRLSLCVLLIFLMALGPALAAETPNPPEKESPSEMLKDATRTILRALGLMLQAIPQYEAPEILDNGDIIIRRKHPTPEPEQKPGNEVPEKTKT